MTATVARYRSPFVSEVLRETDGSIDDCATSCGVMLAGDWTLGEALIRPDGQQMDVLFIREALRKVLGPEDKAGGLTLHDVNDALQKVFGLPPLPRYSGQALEPGQSAAGSGLALTFEAFKERIQNGHVGLLCGIPAGIKNEQSGLRTVQGFDGFKHVIWVGDGNDPGALVKDPLQKRRAGYKGERIPWLELRQFTEARARNDAGQLERAFGSATAIACAVVAVGEQTEVEQARRAARVVLQRTRDEREAAQRAETLAKAAASELRGKLTTAESDVATLKERIRVLESQPAPDCGPIQAALDLANEGIAKLTAKVDAAKAALA